MRDFFPWNRRINRTSPRQWLVLKLVGTETVVANADFTVAELEDGSYLSTLVNVEGDTLVSDVRGLHLPGVSRTN
jgi:hypothetical protein